MMNLDLHAGTETPAPAAHAAPSDPVLVHYARLAALASSGPGAAADLFNEALRSAIGRYLDEHDAQPPPSPPPDGGIGRLATRQRQRVLDHIEANLDDRISTAELAALCHLSASYFARAFKRSTGMPPHRWIMRRRIARAQELLRESDLSLADVALHCGFADQSHLGKEFRRALGRPPGAWRHERPA